MGGVAVQDGVHRRDRGLIRALAGKDVAVADLGIEKVQQFVELAGRGLLIGRLSGVVDRVGRIHRHVLDRLRRSRELRQAGLRHSQPRADIGDRIVVAAHGCELAIQRDGDAASEAEPGIGRGFHARAELLLQVVELLAHVDQRLHRHGRFRADAADRHGIPHICIRVSNMSLIVVSTRALAA